MQKRVTSSPDRELRVAAAGDPDRAAVVAPGAIEHAVGLAELAHEADAARGVGGADVALAVERVADDFRRRWRHRIGRQSVAAEGELRAATVGDPDAVVVEAPRLVEHALRLA